ncbi:MAG: transglycosylase SLT domain-containing protein [Chitinophagaceae bacterium]
MAELLNIPIPDISQSYYDDSDLSSISMGLSSIQDNLSQYISVAAALCKIPYNLILSIIFIESAGKNVGMNGAGAIGLMQVTGGTAYDTIRLIDYAGELSFGMKSIISSKIPSANYKMRGNQLIFWNQNIAIPEINNALGDPQFNILLGSMYLRLALDKTVTSGKARLDKAVIMYNFGMYNPFYSTSDWSTEDSSTLYENPALPTETKNYILKLIGVNGTLDILLNNKT